MKGLGDKLDVGIRLLNLMGLFKLLKLGKTWKLEGIHRGRERLRKRMNYMLKLGKRDKVEAWNCCLRGREEEPFSLENGNICCFGFVEKDTKKSKVDTSC